MKKTMNKETKGKKIIHMINREGADWLDVSKALGHTVQYCQKLARSQYKTETGYNKLLAKAKANKKAKEEAKKLLELNKPTVTEVVVTETGYLMTVGVDGIEKISSDIYVPRFCIKEMEKLARESSVAEEVVKYYFESREITAINLKGREELFVEPQEYLKDRSLGVVALCYFLWLRGYNVRLLTTSKEIRELAKLQNLGILIDE